MKILQTNEPVSPPHEEQHLGNDESTSRIVRVSADRTLTLEEDRAQLERLSRLAALPDTEIDLSEIPEWTEEQFRNAVHGPWTPREPYTVTLRLDAEVIAWLEGEGKKQGYLINLLLKREAQRGQRVRAEQGGPEMDKAS